LRYKDERNISNILQHAINPSRKKLVSTLSENRFVIKAHQKLFFRMSFHFIFSSIQLLPPQYLTEVSDNVEGKAKIEAKSYQDPRTRKKKSARQSQFN
jgi:hypothetical protein